MRGRQQARNRGELGEVAFRFETIREFYKEQVGPLDLFDAQGELVEFCYSFAEVKEADPEIRPLKALRALYLNRIGAISIQEKERWRLGGFAEQIFDRLIHDFERLYPGRIPAPYDISCRHKVFTSLEEIVDALERIRKAEARPLSLGSLLKAESHDSKVPRKELREIILLNLFAAVMSLRPSASSSIFSDSSGTFESWLKNDHFRPS